MKTCVINKFLIPLQSNNKIDLKMSKQKLIITFFLLLAFAYAQGQDKIITTKNDTILCKVVSISLKFIKYEQDGNNHEKVSKLISMKEVQQYSFGLRSQKSSSTTFSGKPSVFYFLDFPNSEQWAEAFEQRRNGFQDEES